MEIFVEIHQDIFLWIKDNQNNINDDEFLYDNIAQLSRMGNIRPLIGPDSPTGEFRMINSETLALILESVMIRWKDPTVMFWDIKKSHPNSVQVHRNKFLLLYMGRS